MEVKEDSEEAEVEATIEEAKVAEANLEDESQLTPPTLHIELSA